jgi:N-methylhydantoinase A
VSRYLVGIDVGGSFTDIVATGPAGVVHYAKTPTYPDDLLRSLRECMEAVGVPSADVDVLRHGTTVVINAILTRSGSTTGLVTTEGFRDVLEIGRTNWPEPYNLFWNRLPVLVPRELRFEVPERVGADTSIVQPLDEDAVVAVAHALAEAGVQSVAVCFLHAYSQPAHELRVREILEQHLPGAYVSLSHELSKEFREYERTSTVVMNAYVGAVVDDYISRFEEHLQASGFEGSLYLMESNGGVTTAGAARRRPVGLVESGPAAGVMATAELSAAMGLDRLIAFDMGGTTAKACLVERGEPLFTSAYYVPDYEHGFPVQVAALDIVEVGTGGGSIASIDEVGMLTVGPESAGAVPGPVCYGGGGKDATVTDANLVLGRLNPARFLGGERPLDVAAAERAVESLATQLGSDLATMARGIVRLANFSMATAIKRVSLERGRDPREYALVAYGGGGPVHGVELARELAVPTVIVPVMPGIFSALGMLLAELRQDFTRTFMHDIGAVGPDALRQAYESVDAEAGAWARSVAEQSSVRLLHYADCRYRGQEFTILVPVDLDAVDVGERLRLAFQVEYERRYGHSFPDLPIETVILRVVAYVGLLKPDLRSLDSAARRQTGGRTERNVHYEGHGYVETPVLQRASLERGDRLEGPVVIEEYGAATVLAPGDSLVVDELSQLVVDVAPAGRLGEPRLDEARA